ncbi:MAG TPA: hypothetical protein VF017_03270 [Thermoanaerobaculia bacterium]|nr:hypothetical protein [Thermoanaerobaculia bacterium]
MSTAEVPAVSPAPAEKEGPNLFRTVLTVAWGAILIALVLEIFLLFVPLIAGTPLKSLGQLVADLAQKISWSFLVCVGVALGTAIRRAQPAAMGALGLISAPLAFTAAKGVHKGVSEALGLSAVALAASPLVIAGLKALEYCVLGFVLGKLAKKGLGLKGYLGVGALAGLSFGTLIVIVLNRASPPPVAAATVVTRGINEMLFPIGCSLVIYAAEVLAKRIKT